MTGPGVRTLLELAARALPGKTPSPKDCVWLVSSCVLRMGGKTVTGVTSFGMNLLAVTSAKDERVTDWPTQSHHRWPREPAVANCRVELDQESSSFGFRKPAAAPGTMSSINYGCPGRGLGVETRQRHTPHLQPGGAHRQISGGPRGRDPTGKEKHFGERANDPRSRGEPTRWPPVARLQVSWFIF